MKPFLVGHNFWCFIDGSHPQPSKLLPSAQNQLQQKNPDFILWHRTDQAIVSIITATLTESILAMVVGCDTARETWDCLQCHYAQKSVANAQNLRFQLFGISKGSQSISEYLQRAKALSDSLASINEPVSNTDLVSSILRGLGTDYTMLVTGILKFSPLPDFEDLRARLLTFENQISIPSQPTQTALLAMNNSMGSLMAFPTSLLALPISLIVLPTSLMTLILVLTTILTIEMGQPTVVVVIVAIEIKVATIETTTGITNPMAIFVSLATYLIIQL